MKNIIEFVEQKIQPIAGKLSAQRHLKALQNAFLTLVPFMTIGSFALLFISPVMDYTTMDPGFFRTFMEGWAYVADVMSPCLTPIYNITMGLIALYVTIGIGYFLSKNYKMNTLLPTFVTGASFFIVCCAEEEFSLSSAYFGSAGIFSGILVSIAAFEFFRFLTNKKVGYINLDSVGVPEAIADGIGNLFPTLIVLLCVSVVSALTTHITGTNFPDIIGLLISPITSLIDTPFGFAFLELFVCLCWWFGIHDGFITGPIDAFLYANLLANASAYASGTPATELPYIVTESFWWSMMLVGGSSCMLGLAFLCLRSKSKHIKTIGKVGIIPSIFNIGEPLLFGLPIAYNSLLLIPYLIISPLCGLIFYFATDFGFLNRSFIYPGWNMPTPISQFLSTMDVRALLLGAALLVLSTLIWYPFIKAYEKQKLAEEGQVQKEEE